MEHWYIIVANLEDHVGYVENTPVKLIELHPENYRTVRSIAGTEWYCGEEELQEISFVTDPVQFAKDMARMFYETRIEGESLYENEDVPREFIERVVDSPLHREIILRDIEADILWDLGMSPDDFQNEYGGYEYFAERHHDYEFAIDAHCERVWEVYNSDKERDRKDMEGSLNFQYEEAPEPQPVVLVTVEGGQIQHVGSNVPNTTVGIIDYDTVEDEGVRVEPAYHFHTFGDAISEPRSANEEQAYTELTSKIQII